MTDRCILWIRDGYLPRLLKKTDGAFHLIAQPVKSLSHRPVEVFTHSYVTPTVTQNPELVTNSRLHFDFIASAHGATWLIMTNCAVFWRFAGVPCSDVLKIQIKTAHIWGVTLVKRLDYCVRWASLTGCSRFHDETGPCDVLAFIWKYLGLLHHTFLIFLFWAKHSHLSKCGWISKWFLKTYSWDKSTNQVIFLQLHMVCESK